MESFTPVHGLGLGGDDAQAQLLQGVDGFLLQLVARQHQIRLHGGDGLDVDLRIVADLGRSCTSAG
jgi:chitinase